MQTLNTFSLRFISQPCHLVIDHLFHILILSVEVVVTTVVISLQFFGSQNGFWLIYFFWDEVLEEELNQSVCTL